MAIREHAQQLIAQVLSSSAALDAFACHYQIHAFEDAPRPEEAHQCAEHLASVDIDARSSGHLTHMAGHIFYLTGEHELAKASFEHSRHVDEAYMRKFGVEPYNNWNFVHNLAFSVMNFAASGRYRLAVVAARELLDMRVEQASFPEPIPFSVKLNRMAARYVFQGMAALPLVHWRYSNFDRCAEAINEQGFQSRLDDLAALHTDNHIIRPYFALLAHYCEGMHAAMQLRADVAVTALKRVAALLDQLLDAEHSGVFHGRLAGTSIDALAANEAELHALAMFAHGNRDEALALMEEAVAAELSIEYNEPPAFPRPVKESIVWLLQQPTAPAAAPEPRALARAASICQQLLHGVPRHSPFALQLAARTAALQGDRDGARAHAQALLEAWPHADDALLQTVEQLLTGQ